MHKLITFFLGAVLGASACYVIKNLEVMGSHNQMLADEHSDYLMPLIPSLEDAIKDDQAFSEFKAKNQKLKWVDFSELGENQVLAWIISERSPYHVGVFKLSDSGEVSAEILLNREFLNLLYGSERKPEGIIP